MMPDSALIGEIMFFAYGFALVEEYGAKMQTTFMRCSEQLSSQVCPSSKQSRTVLLGLQLKFCGLYT